MQKENFKYTTKDFRLIRSVADIKNYLSNGGDINALDISGQSLLTQNIDDIHILNFLLKNSIEINIKNCYGENALHVNKHPAVIKKLIEAGCLIYEKDDFKDYPISKNLHSKEITRIYIDAGFNLNAKDFWIFEYAISSDVLEYAIKKGLDLNRDDKLHPINLIMNLEVAECYVKHNQAYLAKGLNKIEVLFEEELNKRKISDKVFDLYLSAGLDPKRWMTMNLSLNKMKSVAKYFPDRIHEQDEYGNSLLLNYFDSDMSVFDFLLSLGLNINHKNNENKSVLQLLHHWEGAESLIQRGAFIYEDWHNYENSMLARELQIFKVKQEKEKLVNSINVNSFSNNKRL